MPPPVSHPHEVTLEAFDRLDDQLSLGGPGARRIVLPLDTVPMLDAEVIRRLIRLLRRVRERGGNICLRVSRPDLLATLRVTGLDKVFCMVGVAQAV